MAAKKPEKRKLIDWDSVEPLYRAGQMSNYEIANQYEADHVNTQVWKPTVTETAIRGKAKKDGWSHDIAGRVHKLVQEKLVRTDVRIANQTDAEMIEAASDEPVRIAKGQRTRTQNALLLNDDMMGELRDQFDDEVKAFKKKKGSRPDLKDKARIFRELSTTMKSLQDQQAEQYKLNDAGGDGDNAVISVTVDNYGD